MGWGAYRNTRNKAAWHRSLERGLRFPRLCPLQEHLHKTDQFSQVPDRKHYSPGGIGSTFIGTAHPIAANRRGISSCLCSLPSQEANSAWLGILVSAPSLIGNLALSDLGGINHMLHARASRATSVAQYRDALRNYRKGLGGGVMTSPPFLEKKKRKA